MPHHATAFGSTIIPNLRYRDAHAAIDWLCRAFSLKSTRCTTTSRAA